MINWQWRRHRSTRSWAVLSLLLIAPGCATFPQLGGSSERSIMPPSRKSTPTVVRAQQPNNNDLWSDYGGTSGGTSRPRQPMPVSAPANPPSNSYGPAPTSGFSPNAAQTPTSRPSTAWGQAATSRPTTTAQPTTTSQPTTAGGQPSTNVNYSAPTARTAQQPAWNSTGQTFEAPLPPPSNTGAPLGSGATPTYGSDPLGADPLGGYPGMQPVVSQPVAQQPLPADLEVILQEAQTGRFQFGAGINSDAGFSFQVVLDEQNFDWRKVPRNLDDIMDGRAFRGDGQRLRLEAMPGNQVERYLINWTDPFFRDTPVSLNLSGFLFDRRYFDWDERRVGGRVGLGYRLTPDLSLAAAFRGEQVDIHDPRIRGVSELEQVLGETDLYGAKLTLTHDTRDRAFAATEGHLLELSYEQVFGDFDYPRANLDYRRYFLLAERPDGSGRHTLANIWQFGVTGSHTPVFENFFAGGYSTIRGFRFRGASPQSGGVTVGGEFSFLGSLEYMFPISADDMFKGVVFTDYGTVEEKIGVEWDDFRVAVGFGLRFTIPAMGPAPIAVDFAVPVNREETDRIQNFSFFVGLGR